MPFGVAAEYLTELLGTRISEATVRRATLAAGEALVALETKAVELLEKEAPLAQAAYRVLQMSVDGAMVPLANGQWAEARTLAVAGMIWAKGSLQVCDLSYFSRMADHVSFTRLATLETHRRGVEAADLVLAVNDGAEWITGYVDYQRPDAVRILDWAHASGYVHVAGHAAFEGPCGEWCETQLGLLRSGEPMAVLVALAALEDSLPEANPARGVIAQSLAYLAKRLDQIQYAAFTRLGYPIGSGIVESANRTVVQARLKGPGMHWAPSSINPLLALRSAVCSNRWPETWPAIAGQLRHADRQRRTCGRQERSPSALPAAQIKERPPRNSHGRPTKEHPWNRRPAVRPRRAKI